MYHSIHPAASAENAQSERRTVVACARYWLSVLQVLARCSSWSSSPEPLAELGVLGRTSK